MNIEDIDDSKEVILKGELCPIAVVLKSDGLPYFVTSRQGDGELKLVGPLKPEICVIQDKS